MKKNLLLLALLTWISAASAAAAESLPPPLRDVGIDQRLNEPVPLDLAFRDETGREVHLRDYFRGKPVLLVPAYYHCPRLCTLVLSGVAESLRQVGFEMGKDYSVVTFSFDPKETPEMAAERKKACVELYGRPGAGENWHFLLGNDRSIRTLTRSIGYHYTYDPTTDQYAHAAGIMLLTADGKLSRYFYGVDYPPGDVRLGLVEASQNRIGSPVDQVRLFCFHYDPETGRYTPVVMNFVRLGGLLTVAVLGSVFGVLWIRSAREPSLKTKDISHV